VNRRHVVLCVGGLLLAGFWSHLADSAEPPAVGRIANSSNVGQIANLPHTLDKYGGVAGIAGHAGESFHLEKIGRRWWLVTPEGHGVFIRAVSKVDVADYGGSGGFLSCDGVYLQTAVGTLSPNLHAAAASTLARDVVHPATAVTLKTKGDSLYLGSSRLKPNYTYFWLDRLGRGGKLQWYYSTADGWKLVNGTGNPHKAAALGSDRAPSATMLRMMPGSWNLDAGNYMAPDASGFGKWEVPTANKITWWDMANGFPADFALVSLPGDPVRRYWLKTVVEQDFSVPPILNQTYERAELDEAIARKYSPGDYYGKWAKAMTERLRSWGFNAAGQYSYKYVVTSPRLSDRLPVEPTWALGGWATRKDRPYHVKNVYAGAVFPPGGKNLVYQGLQPDVFEPAFERAYVEMVRKEASGKDAWSWALIPEEADYLFGINSLTHDHLGYVTLSQNPYQARASRDGQELVYGDPRLCAKYALRDFLRDRYRAARESFPPFSARDAAPQYTYAPKPSGPELAALQNLNAAWGTHYTTWDSSSGGLLKGTNAWGTGTGWMDENGKSVLASNTRSVGFDKLFTDPAHPAIRKDLDDFIGRFAARYGSVLEKAFSQAPHPVLLLPIYNGPDCVYKALAPHVDGFWVSVADPKDALRIYNAGHKPLLVADYLAADPDSPWHFKAKIESLRYDAASGNTIVTAPDLRYVFRMAQFVNFPDCLELKEKGTCGGRYVYPFPRVKAAHWDTLAVPGDFTGGVKPGMHVEMWKYGKHPYPRPTQPDRARDMIRLYETLMNLRGEDGLGFVIGVEHWCLYDPAVSNWGDNENFGLATLQDNAYDGIEARRTPGTDARGYPIGGEEADYGNLLDGLSGFLKGIDRGIGDRGP